LKIDKQLLDDHQAKLTVEIEEEKMDEMKHRAAKKIARSIKIPGFRPGKAPYSVIARQVGEPAIMDEAMEILIKEVYPDIIKEADIKPYGMGQLENILSLDPVALEFLIPLDVEVTLGDYKSIRNEYQPPQISD
jgi:trigger factor